MIAERLYQARLDATGAGVLINIDKPADFRDILRADWSILSEDEPYYVWRSPMVPFGVYMYD